MENALEIAFYVLGGLIALGFLMVVVLLRDFFFRGRNLVLPQAKRVPTTALDASRTILNRLKAAYAIANGEVRETISYEIKHFENRIEGLEDKTFSDQEPYIATLKRREKIWLEWRTLYEEGTIGGRARVAALRPRMEEIRLHFGVLNKEVEDEYQRCVVRDVLILKELKESGILTPDVLFPDQAKKGRPETAPPDSDQDVATEASDGDAKGDPAQDGDGKEADGKEADGKESAREDEDGKADDGKNAAGKDGPGEDIDAEKPVLPVKKPSKWARPLPPYPPAASGEIRQADISRTEVSKSERTYVDATMSLAGVPGGVLERADFSLSSLAEVELVGIHRYRDCAFIGTDLRRVELGAAGGVHVFQDCNFRGSSLGQSLLCEVIFRRCNLSNTHWRAARLDRVKFENCILDGVNWEGVDLSRTVMSEEMLVGADFSQAGRPPHNFSPPAPEPTTDTSAETSPPSGSAPGEAPIPTAAGPGQQISDRASSSETDPEGGVGQEDSPPVLPEGAGISVGEPSQASPESGAPSPGDAPSPAAPSSVSSPAEDAESHPPAENPEPEE